MGINIPEMDIVRRLEEGQCCVSPISVNSDTQCSSPTLNEKQSEADFIHKHSPIEEDEDDEEDMQTNRWRAIYKSLFFWNKDPATQPSSELRVRKCMLPTSFDCIEKH